MDKEIAEKIFKALNEDEVKHILEDDMSEVIYHLSYMNSRVERISELKRKMIDKFGSISGLIDYIEEEEDAQDLLEVLEGHV